MSLFRFKTDIRAILHPKSKSLVKQQINKKRRRLLNKGLKEIKQSFNNNKDILNIDYYKDQEFIKLMSRQGVCADFAGKRTTNSRMTLGSCW